MNSGADGVVGGVGVGWVVVRVGGGRTRPWPNAWAESIKRNGEISLYQISPGTVDVTLTFQRTHCVSYTH